MGDGIFRKKTGFTAVGNIVVRDKNLSLKAKGLFMLIQSYITIPDSSWKKSDFEKMALDGSKSFESGWNELKDKGYLKTHIFPNVKGLKNAKNGFASEFELLDEPKSGAHTFYYNARGEVTKTNLTKNTNIREKEGDLRYPQKGSNVNGMYVKDTNAKGGNNLKLQDNTLTNIINNKSINHIKQETEIIDLCDEDVVIDKINESGGIPYYFSEYEMVMKYAIQGLVNWTGTLQNKIYDQKQEAIFILMVKCLIEMTLEKTPQKYRNRVVNYTDVIDKINECAKIKSFEKGALSFFVEQTIEKFVAASRQKEIPYVEPYIKSMIWSNFDTYLVDFHAFYERT